MKRNRYAFLLVFSEGQTFTRLFLGRSWKWRVRFILKSPRVAWMLLGSWLIRVLTGSNHRHIMLTDGAVVLDYSFTTVGFYKYEWISIDDTIHGYFCLFTDEAITDWNEFEGRGSKSVAIEYIKRLLMVVTAGIYQCDHCCTISRELLSRCGVDVPRRRWNPKLLLLWLTENGYAFTPGKPPASHGSTDH